MIESNCIKKYHLFLILDSADIFVKDVSCIFYILKQLRIYLNKWKTHTNHCRQEMEK